VVVDINRDAAARLGVTALSIDNALYDAFGQRIISTIYTQSSQNRVILQATPQMLSDPWSAQLYIPLSAGRRCRWARSPRCMRGSPLVLARESSSPGHHRLRCGAGRVAGPAVSAIEKAEKQIGLPASVSTDFSGSASAFQSALANEGVLVAAAIVVVYIVLGVLYESFIHPVTILSTLPSAGIGALIALLLSGYGLG
jgi:multidrug efflux pump